MSSTDGLDGQRTYGDAYADMTAHLQTNAVHGFGYPFAFGYLTNAVRDSTSREQVDIIARALQDAINDHRNTMIDAVNEGTNAR